MDQLTKTSGTPVPASPESDGQTPARNLSQSAHSSPDAQKTVLLDNLSAAPTGTNSNNRSSSLGSSPLPNLNLSSGSLAALSQRYDVLSEAGHGNMGNVYKARDRETGEIVALKLIKSEIASDQAATERFKNELLFARKITHKNVCRVYEFNRIGGIAYTSMEFVEGESLRSVLSRFGGLPVRKGVDLALQICSGLKEAHAQGIIHRDLKPENVMIDSQGNVKIMDFGIARSMESGTHLTGAMIGTPAYMAPEQVSGKPVDYRTDIYALGLVLYEMFTGSETFRADTPVAIAVKQMQEAPAPPHDIDPNIPVYVERAILKCLEKDPAKRFQSVVELENTLRSTRVTGAPMAPAALALAGASALRATPPAVLAHAQPTLVLEPKGKSSALRVAAILAVALLILVGLRAMQLNKKVAQIQSPTVASAPTPPAEAFVAPTPETTPTVVPETTPKTADKTAVKPVAPAEPKPSVAKVFPRMEWGNRTPRAASDTANTFIWVGRFERQERAQEVAQRIEAQNLPVAIRPRRTPQGQQFFVVFTGPYKQAAEEEVLAWLRSIGFPTAHRVKAGTSQSENGANRQNEY